MKEMLPVVRIWQDERGVTRAEIDGADINPDHLQVVGFEHCAGEVPRADLRILAVDGFDISMPVAVKVEIVAVPGYSLTTRREGEMRIYEAKRSAADPGEG